MALVVGAGCIMCYVTGKASGYLFNAPRDRIVAQGYDTSHLIVQQNMHKKAS
jgi:hypothetical protein